MKPGAPRGQRSVSPDCLTDARLHLFYVSSQNSDSPSLYLKPKLPPNSVDFKSMAKAIRILLTGHQPQADVMAQYFSSLSCFLVTAYHKELKETSDPSVCGITEFQEEGFPGGKTRSHKTRSTATRSHHRMLKDCAWVEAGLPLLGSKRLAVSSLSVGLM